MPLSAYYYLFVLLFLVGSFSVPLEVKCDSSINVADYCEISMLSRNNSSWLLGDEIKYTE